MFIDFCMSIEYYRRCSVSSLLCGVEVSQHMRCSVRNESEAGIVTENGVNMTGRVGADATEYYHGNNGS